MNIFKMNKFHLITQLEIPYVTAIVAYALALANSDRKALASQYLQNLSKYDKNEELRYWSNDQVNCSDEDKASWYTHKSTAVNVETTAYALLTYLHHGNIEYSGPIIKWLIKQRNIKGSFISTQDTVVALQALSEYSMKSQSPKLALRCEIFSLDSTFKAELDIRESQAELVQTIKVPASETLVVDVSGVGIGQMQVDFLYNSPDAYKEQCKFSLIVEAIEPEDSFIPKSKKMVSTLHSFRKQGYTAFEHHVQNKFPKQSTVNFTELFLKSRVQNRAGFSTLDLKSSDIQQNNPHISKFILLINICVRYLGENSTSMSIIEVGLFTGFKVVEKDIEKLISMNEFISFYEVSGRSVILYLDKIPSDKDYCFSFHVVREIQVGSIQPVAIRVYDYYNPDDMCIVFYHPKDESPPLQQSCIGEICSCSKASCSVCYGIEENMEEPLGSDRLLQKACQNNAFVYVIHISDVEDLNSLQSFKIQVITVAKEGRDTIYINEDDKRLLIKTTSCNCPKLKTGENYLIIGHNSFKYRYNNSTIKYKYVLDKDTYIERFYNINEDSSRAEIIASQRLSILIQQLKISSCESIKN